MNKQLIAMHEPFALEYLERRANVTPEERKEADISYREAVELARNPASIYSVNGSMATMNISGPLSRKGPDAIDLYFGYGGTGYEMIIAAAEALSGMDEIEDVKIHFNTGGGYVDGLDEAFQALFKLNKTKNVTAINEGMIGSAGYYLAVASNKILAVSPAVETGSIGVKVVGYDFSGYLKDAGIKRVVILSKNAPNKDYTIETAEGRKSIQSNIDAMERIFYMRVSQGRGVDFKTIKSDFGKGALMVAFDPDESTADAISVGMIDGFADTDGNMIELQMDHEKDNEGADSSLIKPSGETETSTEGSKEKCGQTSASIQETHTVSKKLKELLAENSGAQSEYDAAVAEAKTGGFTEGKAEVNAEVEARVKAAETVFGAEAAYPKAINELAIKVMFGTEPKSSLTASVATIDAMRQEAASLAGGEETTEIGGTGGEQAAPGKIDGVAKTEDDFQAQLQQGKKQLNGTGA